jgi:ABC-type nickel/cobalt efflux system permease component RcnA
MKHESEYIAGTVILTATSWHTELQPIFSILASLSAIILAIFGIVNYWKKWKREEKNRLDSE